MCLNDLVEKIKRFPLKVKSFGNTATCQKLSERGSINLLTHPTTTTTCTMLGDDSVACPLIRPKVNSVKAKRG